MLNIFDGKAAAAELDEKIKAHISSTTKSYKLLIVQIGNNSASEKFVSLKKKYCDELDISVELVSFSRLTDYEELYDSLLLKFNDITVTGVIVQMPLPEIKYYQLINLIPREKDIDCLRFPDADEALYVSPTVRALRNYLQAGDINVSGKKVGVIGGGDLVAGSLVKYLTQSGADITIYDNEVAYSKFSYLEPHVKNHSQYRRGDKLNYDLTILSTGIPGLVSPVDFEAGANVVDFGSGILSGKVCGDLDYSQSTKHLGFLAPSPGGMGPLVIRYLIMNLLGI